MVSTLNVTQNPKLTLFDKIFLPRVAIWRPRSSIGYLEKVRTKRAENAFSRLFSDMSNKKTSKRILNPPPPLAKNMSPLTGNST